MQLSTGGIGICLKYKGAQPNDTFICSLPYGILGDMGSSPIQ